MKHTQALSALFAFRRFRARSRLQGTFGDPHAWLVTLVWRKNGRVLRLRDMTPTQCVQGDGGRVEAR
jgi:hypothetical protein